MLGSPLHYAGFGEAGDAELAALDVAMRGTLQALHTSIATLRQKIEGMSDFDYETLYLPWKSTLNFLFRPSEETRAGVLSGLRTMDSIVARMDGTRMDVLAGLEAPEKWQAAASTVARGIEAQAAILNDDTGVRLLIPAFAELQDTTARWRDAAVALGRKIANFSLVDSMPWWGWVAGGVVSLGVVGYFLSAVAPFIPRRR